MSKINLTIGFEISVSLLDPAEALKKVNALKLAIMQTLPPEQSFEITKQLEMAGRMLAAAIYDLPPDES